MFCASHLNRKASAIRLEKVSLPWTLCQKKKKKNPAPTYEIGGKRQWTSIARSFDTGRSQIWMDRSPSLGTSNGTETKEIEWLDQKLS